MRLRWLFALALLASAPARAVIIASGDGTGNTSVPPDDPGFANVGKIGSLSAIYLGNTWVLTASHVGIGNPVFEGVPYTAIPGSGIQLRNPDQTLADALVFRIVLDPHLPSLARRTSAPPPGAELVLIGNGRDRGAATTWMGKPGWFWGGGATLRWGTNVVLANGIDVDLGGMRTRSFDSDFTLSAGTPHEAMAALGDSGGAAFVRNGSQWELGGVLYAIATWDGQPAGTAIDGDLTFAVDLSYYGVQLSNIVATPVCADGLDNDGDGQIDAAQDAGCRDAYDAWETIDCDDGIDNDGDGLVDAGSGPGNDPGCLNRLSFSRENPACSNAVDDDGDMLADWPADPQCTAPWNESESPAPPACGLLGVEPLLLAAALQLVARRRRR